MARKSRSSQKTSLYFIKQKTHAQLFRDNTDRLFFINLLEKLKEKYEFSLYGFCVVEDNTFYLLLDTKKQPISRLIQSLSISYSKYRSDLSKLFNTRYQSISLFSHESLKHYLDAMHHQKNEDYSSFCLTDTHAKYGHLITQSFEPIAINLDHQQIQSAQLMTSFLAKHGCSYDEVIRDKNLRNECIAKLYKESNCSLDELGLLFELSSSSISKIISSKQTI